MVNGGTAPGVQELAFGKPVAGQVVHGVRGCGDVVVGGGGVEGGVADVVAAGGEGSGAALVDVAADGVAIVVTGAVDETGDACRPSSAHPTASAPRASVAVTRRRLRRRAVRCDSDNVSPSLYGSLVVRTVDHLLRGASLPCQDPAVDHTELEEVILAVLRLLEPGEVVSYGDVADDAGFPGRSRAVGRLLATTAEDVPWWRVVNAAGRLVPGNEPEHAARLRAEGVTVHDGRVVRSPLGRFAR